MPPSAAFCPVFGGAFTVRFVTFSVVMGDGNDLNVMRRPSCAPKLVMLAHTDVDPVAPQLNPSPLFYSHTYEKGIIAASPQRQPPISQIDPAGFGGGAFSEAPRRCPHTHYL